MDINIIEKFFVDDIKSKELIESIRPSFNEQIDYSKNKFVDDMLNSLKELKNIYKEMFNINGLDIYFDKINLLFIELENRIVGSYNDMFKLQEIYEKYILSMNKDLEKSLEKNICAYSMSNYKIPLEHLKSLNDILHFIHFSFINNEGIYRNNIIDTYKNGFDSINLVGKENSDARSIFNSLKKEENKTLSAKLDILALDNMIFIMARDLGHATVIEIEKEKDNYRVKYFIPKVCNYNKVNKLPGVNKINSNDKTTRGEFLVKEDFINTITNFIKALPTDMDIKINNELDEMLKDEKEESESYGKH